MKNTKRTVALLLCLVSLFAFASCGNVDSEKVDLWETAIYKEDTEIGEGENTVFVTVEAGDKAIKLTVRTDETNLGKALQNLETPIVEGDEGAYGLYVKKVNGIFADYDVDGAYWSFMKNGEIMMAGIDGVEFEDKESYEFVYTKG